MKKNSFIVVGIGFLLIATGSYFKQGRATALPASFDAYPAFDSRMAPSAGLMKASAPASNPTFSIRGTEFKAIMADTPALRERGLSGRKGLGRDEAMLFAFESPDLVGFWMKDMLFPIDILFLDENLKVISFAKNVSPDSYPEAYYPESPAKYVIEFNQGTLDKLKIKKGDSVEIQP